MRFVNTSTSLGSQAMEVSPEMLYPSATSRPLISEGTRTGGPMAVTVAQDNEVPHILVAFRVMM